MASKKQITVGGVAIGGGAPIRVQTMCTTKTYDPEATIAQILACEAEGAELIRVSVPNEKSARALPAIKAGIHIPLIADIHFDYRMAILSTELGADCIRINPGNIGSKKRVDEVIAALKAHGTPVRIGVNSGSLEKDLIDKHGGVTVAALVESAERNIGYFEDAGVEKIKVSIKSSHVPTMIRCYEELSRKTDWPLHLGVTEAGPFQMGAIKSAIGLGTLLQQGIGDTVRVSLSCDPQREIPVALEILKALDLAPGVNIISCPSCARADINVEELAEGVLARETPEGKRENRRDGLRGERPRRSGRGGLWRDRRRGRGADHPPRRKPAQGKIRRPAGRPDRGTGQGGPCGGEVTVAGYPAA